MLNAKEKCFSAESYKHVMCQRITWHIHWWRWFWKPEVPNLWVGFPPKGHKRNLGGCKMIKKKSWMSRSHWSIQSLEGCYALWMVPCVEAKRCPESQRDIKGAQQQYRAKLRKAQLEWQQGESQCTPFNAHRNRNTELFIYWETDENHFQHRYMTAMPVLPARTHWTWTTSFSVVWWLRQLTSVQPEQKNYMLSKMYTKPQPHERPETACYFVSVCLNHLHK